MSAIATAIIGGAVIGGVAQDRAASKAAKAQLQSGDRAIDFQQKSLDQLTKLLEPFTTGGTGAFKDLLDIVGVNGSQKASQAIIDVEGSPEFTAMTRQGEEAILANAAATGKLRGGDTQAALAEFRPQLLNSLVNQRINRLLAVSQFGQNSAARTGTAAIQTGANAGNILQNQGEAIGSAYLAKGNNVSNIAGDAGFAIARYLSKSNTGNGLPESSMMF